MIRRKSKHEIHLNEVYSLRDGSTLVKPLELREGWVRYKFWAGELKRLCHSNEYLPINEFLDMYELGVSNPFFKD